MVSFTFQVSGAGEHAFHVNIDPSGEEALAFQDNNDAEILIHVVAQPASSASGMEFSAAGIALMAVIASAVVVLVRRREED
jgi:hypothetical protein